MDPKQTLVTVCGGTGCLSNGSARVAEVLDQAIKTAGMDVNVQLKITGCHGFCERGPIVVIEPIGIQYQGVGKKKLELDIDEIVASLKDSQEPVQRLLYKNPISKELVPRYNDIPFYAKQYRVVLRNNGRIDPGRIEDYLAHGGYAPLAKVMTMDPEEVIKEVQNSDLRGRGGAGFPTGVKWMSCRRAPGDIRYVICNGDEGDPGAFMDRSIMEGDPHSVLEGMLIAAWAVSRGVSPVEGYIYVRAEYPLAVQNLGRAIEQARTWGFLGRNILGMDFDFDITISQGAGAFVCGESSALMRSIEGHAGEPRVKYIRSVEKGLWDKPTNLNNVETYANIPVIIEKGAEWFRNIGVKGNGGTKVFSLVGKVKNTGLVEVPLGSTVRQVVFEIGGGITNDKPFKAVLTGGPSGGCLPESKLDLPLTFESLAEAGSMMGSGGMIVLDSESCMVDVARYYLHFTSEESCGKCMPCREGTGHMLGILERICAGEGVEEDITLLERLGKGIASTSLCGLGQSAPNPVLSTLMYFKDEYLAHIRDKKCPAGVCKKLISYRIDPAACTACGVCRRNCPVEAITGEKKVVHVIDPGKCVKCGACREGCKFDAVLVE
jgi:NADH-quinone oxidoreductase subunit F